jgi:hypothetical protein
METYAHRHKNTKNSKQNANPMPCRAARLPFSTPPTATVDSHQRHRRGLHAINCHRCGLRHAADRHRNGSKCVKYSTSIKIQKQMHKNLFIAHNIKEMHKNQNENIEILLAYIGSFSFPTDHLFIQGCNQKSNKNIMKKQERRRNMF